MTREEIIFCCFLLYNVSGAHYDYRLLKISHNYHVGTTEGRGIGSVRVGLHSEFNMAFRLVAWGITTKLLSSMFHRIPAFPTVNNFVEHKSFNGSNLGKLSQISDGLRMRTPVT